MPYMQWHEGRQIVRELYYSALDLAAISISANLSAKEEANFLENVWTYERAFLFPENREEKRKFILTVLYWKYYLQDKGSIDSEFPAICKDFIAMGSMVNEEEFICDDTDLNLFFKSIRIRILFLNERDYTRIKLRTLLRMYGYHRRSQKLLQHIRDCLFFYHLQPYERGNVKCEIDDIPIDEMITFRVQ